MSTRFVKAISYGISGAVSFKRLLDGGSRSFNLLNDRSGLLDLLSRNEDTNSPADEA